MPKMVKLLDGSEFELDDALVRIQDAGTVVLNDDNAVFFQRQLEFIEAQTYDTLYPELEAREAFGVDTTGGPGVTTLTYRSYNHVGKAQVINARATDLPKSSLSGKEYSITVKSVGTAYDYDIDEVAAASVTGLPLEARKAMAATRGYEQYVNSTAWYGDAANGFVGFFDHPDITKANVAAGRGVWEFRLEDGAYQAGDLINAEIFQAGQLVDVTGQSKGKGFAGTIKRWNFRGQDNTHGNSVSHRVPGSIGQCQTPGRVFKGKKMSGHMGAERVTVQSLEVVRVDAERNLLLVKGAVPGAPGGDVVVRPAAKARG